MLERAAAARRAALDSLLIGDQHVSPTPYYHNTPMLGRIDKAVLRAPLAAAPKPAYFLDNKKMRDIGERLTRFAAAPSLGGVAGVAMAALRG